MVIAAMGTVLAAAYLLWLYQRTAFGEPKNDGHAAGHDHGHDHGHSDGHGHDTEEIHDVTMFEWIAWTPLLAAILLFGVVPNLLFKVIDPAVASILTNIGG
jgi:NADH-quinone oxidoreductase subunit M